MKKVMCIVLASYSMSLSLVNIHTSKLSMVRQRYTVPYLSHFNNCSQVSFLTFLKILHAILLWKQIAIEVAEKGLRPALPKHDDDEQTKEIIELIQHLWDEDSAMRPAFATITCALINIHKALLTHAL